MSTPTSQLPTRQQLDEIDSLLRRMLSLPPLATDAPTADMPPPRVVEYSPPPGHAAPMIRETTPQHHGSSASTDPVVQSWRVSWPTIAAQAQAEALAQAAAPPASSGSVTAWGSPVVAQNTLPATTPVPSVIPPAVATPNQPLSYGSFFPLPADATRPGASGKTTAVEDSQPMPLVFLPLTILNGLFDIVTYLFGPLGTWMRYDGRRMLGWMGILMVVGAIGWGIGEWRGVDWPKPDWVKRNLPGSDWRPDWLK
jgi:hypothetical protein